MTHKNLDLELKKIKCKWGRLTLRIPSAIINEYKNNTCYPPANKIFKAFSLCPLNKVRVVIIGQDPYPGKGKANGLAFSQDKIEDSLKNIKTEVDKAGFNLNSPDLTSWAKQGVLLMNTWLSVKENEPKSHRDKRNKKYGWKEHVTKKIMEELNNCSMPIVFLLWGNEAINLANKIRHNPNHKCLLSSHPSDKSYKVPLKKANNKSFYNCNHFKEANDFLTAKGMAPINWSTP